MQTDTEPGTDADAGELVATYPTSSPPSSFFYNMGPHQIDVGRGKDEVNRRLRECCALHDAARRVNWAALRLGPSAGIEPSFPFRMSWLDRTGRDGIKVVRLRKTSFETVARRKEERDGSFAIGGLSCLSDSLLIGFHPWVRPQAAKLLLLLEAAS